MDLIVISDVSPSVDDGRWPVKRIQGDDLCIEATVFAAGGNSEIAVEVEVVAPDGAVSTVPMTHSNPGLDRWSAHLTLKDPGCHRFRIVAWVDAVRFHRLRLERKAACGRDPYDELDGLLALVASLPETAVHADFLARCRELLTGGSRPARVEACFSLLGLLAPFTTDLRRFTTDRGPYEVVVEHPLAREGAWYQLFPRSEGMRDGGGTLRDAADALNRVADMGFSVVYLPPIHPIGRTHRKGPDDTALAGPGDPGSPWAVGSEHGGHDAVHPDLGTEQDLVDFVRRGRELGVETALDFALNFSPDHPWVAEHPEWFNRRADGSFIPAGTADKYYQDIYTLDFDGPHAEAIARACQGILEHWLDLGVWVFRVDLPHTKPLWFWERTIAAVKAERPHAVFLAEAFTKPTMMHWMSKAGFSQTLTYFLWRETKPELEDYLTELHSEEQREYLRPNLFVNSHDYLPPHLRDGNRATFALRAGLASMASPTWGMYSGYELLESTPRTPDATKYAGSEIYQLVRRDWSAPPLASWITTLNRIRREHPALLQLGNLTLHPVDNDTVLAFSRVSDDDIVLVVAGLDCHTAQDVTICLSANGLGLPNDHALRVVDELTGARWEWHGDRHKLRLDPADTPVLIFTIHR